MVGTRNLIVILAPCGNENDALIGLRLKGKKTQYVIAISKLYTYAALWYAEKEKAARKKARQSDIKWKQAKKEFAKENKI